LEPQPYAVGIELTRLALFAGTALSIPAHVGLGNAGIRLPTSRSAAAGVAAGVDAGAGHATRRVAARADTTSSPVAAAAAVTACADVPGHPLFGRPRTAGACRPGKRSKQAREHEAHSPGRQEYATLKFSTDREVTPAASGTTLIESSRYYSRASNR